MIEDIRKCSESWSCTYAAGGNPQFNGGYAIVPFGDYYGLYYWNETQNGVAPVARYLKVGWGYSIGPGAAAATGLPPEAQFSSVEQCQEQVASGDSARLVWVRDRI